MAPIGSTSSSTRAHVRPARPTTPPSLVTVLALAGTLAACTSDSPTQIVVVVDADAALRPQIGRVTITALRIPDARAFDRTTQHPPDTLPVSIALTHVAGALGPIEIVATAYDANNRLLITHAATTQFQPGHIRLLRLDLYSECREPCANGKTCGQTGCVSREEAGRLLPWPGRIEPLPPYVGGLRNLVGPDAGAGGEDGGVGGADGGGATSGNSGGSGGMIMGGAGGSGGNTGGSGGNTGGSGGNTGGSGGMIMGGAGGSGGSRCVIETRREGIACPTTQSRWTLPISMLDMKDDNSDVYMASLGASSSFLVPEFGGQADPGFPWIAVPMNQPTVMAIYIVGYGPSLVPFPPDIPIRAHASRHVIAVQRDTCVVYEGWECAFENSRWRCRAGRGYSLTNYNEPPTNLMGSDPSGIEIYPLLIKKWEVDVGTINHALRVTVARTRNQFIWPATNTDSSESSTAYPPLGARLRLRPDITIPSTLSPATRTILTAARTYGMLVTAHGTNFAIAGESHCDWDPTMLAELAAIPATWFEFLYDGL